MYARETFPLAKALTQSFVAGMPDANVRSARPGPYEAGLVSFGGEERITQRCRPGTTRRAPSSWRRSRRHPARAGFEAPPAPGAAAR